MSIGLPEVAPGRRVKGGGKPPPPGVEVRKVRKKIKNASKNKETRQISKDLHARPEGSVDYVLPLLNAHLGFLIMPCRKPICAFVCDLYWLVTGPPINTRPV